MQNALQRPGGAPLVHGHGPELLHTSSREWQRVYPMSPDICTNIVVIRALLTDQLLGNGNIRFTSPIKR